MNLLQIRYFVAVAEELNFRKAADRLHVSQPPLSFHIKALEDEVGVRLFNRSTRQVVLTEAGAMLLARARQILELVERTSADMKAVANGSAGTLRVAFTISTSYHAFFHRIIQAYRRSYPRVDLVLDSQSSGPQIEALLNGRIDVGLLRWPFEAVPQLVGTRLHSATLMLAVHSSHPLARDPVVQLEKVRDDPFITYPRSRGSEIGIYRQIHRLCDNAGFAPKVAHEVLEPSIIIGLVAAGAGVAIVPSSMTCLRIPGVVYKPIADPSAETALHLVRRADDTNPRIASFCDVALATVREEEEASLLNA